jgi:class 3 adenylate cyclase
MRVRIDHRVSGPEPVNVTDDEVDTNALRLVRWGLRFARSATEADYRAWQVRTGIPFARAALIASLISWMLALGAVGLADRAAFARAATWIIAVMMPALLGALAITYRPRLLQWVAPSIAVVDSVAGLVLVGLCAGLLDMLQLSALPAVAIFYFATVFRLRPELAFAAGLPVLVFDQVLFVQGFLAGHLGGKVLIAYSFSLWIHFGVGTLACAVADRFSRDAYRQERIVEQQREIIQRERERSDGLLRNVLAEAIAERLKKNPARIAEHFDEVTVLFGDIAGFTPMSAGMAPAELVAELDEIFSRFDDIAHRHGLEKIKTIGDAYMVVAGVPVARADHAEAIAEMALEMRDAIASCAFSGGRRLEMRIGIHSGPVVAGVIGKKKFTYDLWGDTVNTASRMESHGLEGKVHVSEATADRLRQRFALTARGPVQIKGKGEMRTWFLDGKRP